MLRDDRIEDAAHALALQTREVRMPRTHEVKTWQLGKRGVRNATPMHKHVVRVPRRG